MIWLSINADQSLHASAETLAQEMIKSQDLLPVLRGKTIRVTLLNLEEQPLKEYTLETERQQSNKPWWKIF